MYNLVFNRSLLTEKESEIITASKDGLAVLDYDKVINRHNKLIVGIHDGMFHADEILSLTLLQESLGVNLELIRTRDPKVLENCDLRIDVGEGLLDHHGKQAAPGVAACTKVAALLRQTWMTNGSPMDDEDFEININYLEDITNRVAAWDCGDNSKEHPFPWVHTFSECSNMERSETSVMKSIEKCIDMLSAIINAELSVLHKKAQSSKLAEEQLAAQSNEQIVVFNADARWADVKQLMHTKKSACIYYISPESEDDWRILCAADQDKEFSPFSSKQLLPEQFRGLRGEALSEKSGIEDAIFCHAAGFIAGFKNEKSAVAFAKLALEECSK